ncbi:MAG: 30S ribosomal protein S1 [Oligoflexia bacterium]|nr:30S ribosomal protein S1 [Oligoflexia bacterium]
MSARQKINLNEIFEDDIDENSSSMMDLMDDNEVTELSSSQIIKGTVIGVAQDFVTVDVGFKSEGRIQTTEFLDAKGNLNVSVGDEIEVFVANADPGSGGLNLSRARAKQIKSWENIEQAFAGNTSIEAEVIAVVKGGVNIDIDGVKGFMPASQTGERAYHNLDELVGRKVPVKIVDFNRKKANLIVSHKHVLTEEKDRLRSEILPQLKEGAVFRGRVKNLTDYGVFVDIGGIDGLVHITDLSWGRLKHPREVVAAGDILDVVVLKYDESKHRLTLGVKQLKEDPWYNILSRYSVGGRVSGRIVGITDYGAFMEIEPGVEGMIHVSEMSWSGKIKKPSQLLKKDDNVEVVILEIDTGKRKISLGLKQIGENPWDALKVKYPEGTRLRGRIKNVTDFGLFIDIGEEFDCLVRSADITWDTREKNPVSMFQKDQEIEAVLLSIVPEKQRILLGIKQLTDDPWLSLPERYPAGRGVEGKIVKVTDFGVFVELEPAVDGLIHSSETMVDKSKKLSDHFKVGDPVKCVILSVDKGSRRISLSIKALVEKQERDNVNSFMAGQEDVKVSLGQMLKDKMSVTHE